MTAPSEPFNCWVVTDGRVGIENQALGLAEAVSRLLPVKITLKRIVVKNPWRSLPRAFWGDPFTHLSTEGALLRPPYPELWIGCGRLSIPYGIAVREIEPAVMTVQLQHPRAPLEKFSLVVPPEHDDVRGENVLAIVGSPNRVNIDAIRRDTARLGEALVDLPAPRVALLIGGPNGAFDMDEKAIMRIARVARKLVRAGRGVMVTSSRRTPPSALETVSRALQRFPHFIWNGAPVAGLANPYFGILGLADLVFVTEDSVNMAAEAATAGKPVNVIPLPLKRFGQSPRKFRRFHEALADHGAARLGAVALDPWSFPPFDETARAADEIARRLLAANPSRQPEFATSRGKRAPERIASSEPFL